MAELDGEKKKESNLIYLYYESINKLLLYI